MNVYFHLKYIACVLFIVFLGFASLAKSAESDTKNTAKILKLGVHVSEMGRLDPHLAAGSQDRAFTDMVFNSLFRYKPGEAPKIEPDLAAGMPEFRMDGNKQVWTIFLKKGVMFHSGPGLPSYELTADDVVYSLKKSADAKFSAYAGGYSGWEVSKIDGYTIKIVLHEPVSPILFLPKLTNYAGGFIVSKKAIEVMGYEEFSQHPIGTGPFQYDSYEKGKKLALRAHEHFFRGKPLLGGVELFFFPDLSLREKHFLANDLHVITGSGEKGWIEKMEGISGVTLDTFGVGEVSTIFFNMNAAPFHDIRVRKAVMYALDRAEFLKTTSDRIAGEVFSPVPEMFLPGGLTHEEVKLLELTYEKDLELARKLLVEAGYAHGLTLNLVASEKRLYQSLYRVLQKELAKVGITCNLNIVKHSEMHKQIRKKPKAMVIYAAWRPNADAYLTRFFHSDSIVVTGENPDTNFSHYDAIDRLIEDARLEIFPEKQINLWKQAQIRILSEAIAYPLLYTRQFFVRKSGVNYGHNLKSTMALYPQITEKTHY